MKILRWKSKRLKRAEADNKWLRLNVDRLQQRNQYLSRKLEQLRKKISGYIPDPDPGTEFSCKGICWTLGCECKQWDGKPMRDAPIPPLHTDCPCVEC